MSCNFGTTAIVVIAPLAFFFGLEEYQQSRVTTFLNPENDPLGAGYHITQSKIAIGSGGIFGKGFLNGSQSHLDYLPEGHTDFVFATMAEEWGLMGGAAVLFGFFFLFRWGLGVATKAKTRFSQLVAAGLTTTIFFYVAVNLMMVMGLAPVVGIPLPFLSHGGSSTLLTTSRMPFSKVNDTFSLTAVNAAIRRIYDRYTHQQAAYPAFRKRLHRAL